MFSKFLVSIFAVLMLTVSLNASVSIIPEPKVLSGKGWIGELSPEWQIVTGDKAGPTEKLAAEILQQNIQQRFGMKIAIISESNAPSDRCIIVGLTGNNRLLDSLCQKHGLKLAGDEVHPDEFLVEVLRDENKQYVLLAGSNGRAVTYAQDVFFELLTKKEGKVEFAAVSVHDWASIAWRGRPSYRRRDYLMPGSFEAYTKNRINWIDLREVDMNKAPPDSDYAMSGVPITGTIDQLDTKKIIDEAHRRDIYVYGTVACGIKNRADLDKVRDLFRQFLKLGVDGLWISFDDAGSGADPNSVLGGLLEFAQAHKVALKDIGFTSRQGSYQQPDTAFNRNIVNVPGMESITWFFTCEPTRKYAEDAARVGIKSKPAWWHNWPRTIGGFTHNSYLGRSLRTDGEPYLPIPRLDEGWHNLGDDALRDVPQHIGRVMMWGQGPEEYVIGIRGIWGWNPEKCNSLAV